ncbi:PD-(D/E)XK motif protein [Embleya sp. NPDC005575]|uniref:PD-(D/E)XK motif protein n=1 Tax=Embleya sp. NPDC005575 TaxID=3156892 RepID=UPI0033AEEBB9
MSADHRSRHLSCDAPRDHLDNRIPVAPGTKAPRLGMHGIRAVCVLDGGEQFLQVSIEQTKLLREFHIVCCEIADRVQVEGSAPVPAVQETVLAWRRLLARGRRMSLQEEIGLFGELLTLIGLAAPRRGCLLLYPTMEPDQNELVMAFALVPPSSAISPDRRLVAFRAKDSSRAASAIVAAPA